MTYNMMQSDYTEMTLYRDDLISSFDAPNFEESEREPSRPRALDSISTSHKNVWRTYLHSHGIDAGIVTLHLRGGERYAYLIGFDELCGHAAQAQALLAYADRMCLRSEAAPVRSFRVAETLDFWSCNINAQDRAMQELPALLAEHDHGLAATSLSGSTRVNAVFFRHINAESFSTFDRDELQQILPLLAEHGTVQAQLLRESNRSSMFETMFDKVSMSVFLLDADVKPIFANNSAKSLLKNRRWLSLSPDGTLACNCAEQTRQLRKSISAAFQTNSGEQTEIAMRLDSRDGDWRLAYVVPARSHVRANRQRCAMLVVVSPGKINAPTQLLQALGLLPSEQRFLNHFLRANSLGDAALDCGLSEESARTYLKRVRAKLGVSRQMELASLISSLSMPIHSSDFDNPKFETMEV